MARQEDELKSLRRFIKGAMTMASPDQPTIYTERPEKAPFSRPAFKIDNPSGSEVDGSGQMYFDERLWVVTYMAKSRSNASQVGESWIEKLKKQKPWMVIPLWLFDFVYMPAILREVTGQSTSLTAGTYSVQLVGEDLLGNITKPSPVASITIAAGSAIDVQSPQTPMGMPLAKKLHVYLGGSQTSPTGMHRVGNTIMQNGVDPVLRVSSDVPNGQTSGNALALLSSLPAKSEVRYRYMRAMGGQIRAEIVEDPEEDGFYNHVVRLRTQTIAVRDYDHSQALGTIIIAQTVSP